MGGSAVELGEPSSRACRTRRRHRLLAPIALATMVVALALVMGANPAGATFDTNGIGCQGHGVITPNSGTPFTVDANQSEVHLPRSAKAPIDYTGSVTTITHNHNGYVALKVGPWKVHFYSWSGANKSNKPSDAGKRDYPSELKHVPPGKYQLTGGHFAPEGSCTGHMTVIIDGSPLSSPIGAGAAAGTVVFAGLAGLAGLKRRSVA